MKRVVAGVALVGIALLAYFLLRGDEEASAESKYDGVHLCAPSQQEAATVAAGKSGSVPTPSGNLDLEPSRIKGPLFAQNASAWGGEEYDQAAKQDVGCGATIAQCGCAMTSVATILALFQLMTTPDGKDLNPSSLNAWFNEGAQLTSGGWTSQGYSFGNVVWTAVNNFSAAVPGTERAKSIRFAGWGSGSEDEIRSQLQKGNRLSIEVPGHYVAAIGLQGDQILINDPFYANRTTLDAYEGLVRSSRVYEPSNDLSGIMISVPADQRVRVKDAQGREVGTLGGKDPQDAEKDAKTDIPGAQYHFEEAWRDPTCTERPPQDGQGVNSIFLPNPQDGNYIVEVLGEKSTSVAVYLYDKGGALRMITREGGETLQFDFSYGSGGGSPPSVTPTPTATPTATPTPTPTPTAVTPVEPPEQEEEPTEQPITVTPSVTATSTQTSVPSAAMWISPPTVQALSLAIPPSSGCRTSISWNAGGDSKGKVELLRNSQPIFTGGIGPMTYHDPFAPGTWTYVVRATNSDGAVVTSPPLQVTPACLLEYRIDIVDTCSDGCDELRHVWRVQGNQSGSVKIVHSPDGFVVATVPINSSSLLVVQDFACPDAYHIVVTVGTASVNSPVVQAPPHNSDCFN